MGALEDPWPFLRGSTRWNSGNGILLDWDRLPLIGPTHLELHNDPHVKGRSRPQQIRRLAITMPLDWARLVIAGTHAYTAPLGPGGHRSTLPMFSADFILAAVVPEEVRARHMQEAAEALYSHPVPELRDVRGSSGTLGTVMKSFRRRLTPVAWTAFRAPLAQCDVVLRVDRSGNHFTAVVGRAQTTQRVPI